MGQVSVNVNGRDYPVACDDGQEDHVSRLGEYLDKRASGLSEQVGAVSEGRLLVMTGLLVADELSEAYDEVEKLQQEAKEIASKARNQALEETEDSYALALNTLAEKIERIADSLQKN